MARKREELEAAAGSGSLSTLGDLLRRHGLAQTAAAPTPTPAPPPAPGQPGLGRGAKIVVRRERKGHGGKTVTVIDGLPLASAQLDALARSLRKAFGCGGRVEGGRICLQGDRADAAEAWLRANGARSVIRGN